MTGMHGALLVIALWAIPATSVAGADCEEFALLVRDSGNHFSEIRGKGTGRGRQWVDLVWKLPGATSCAARASDDESPRGVLQCTWAYGRFASGSLVRRDEEQLLAAARSCLAPLLAELEPADSGDAGIVRGLLKGRQEVFEFSTLRDSTSRGWELTVIVSRTSVE